MARHAQVLVALLVLTTTVGAARADDAVFTARVGTLQGPSAAGTLVLGKPYCFLFDCGGSAGMSFELEAGASGVKGAVGVGIADRGREGVGLATAKAALFRSWSSDSTMSSPSIFVGPELDFASRWGVTLGAYKRIGAPGWRVNVGIVRAF